MELLHRKHRKPHLDEHKIYVKKVGLLAWPLKKQHTRPCENM